jgi:hypothetical protein
MGELQSEGYKHPFDYRKYAAGYNIHDQIEKHLKVKFIKHRGQGFISVFVCSLLQILIVHSDQANRNIIMAVPFSNNAEAFRSLYNSLRTCP